jgi:threonine dehydratase
MTAPTDLQAPTLEDIQAARRRLAGIVLRTPLVRLNWEPPASGAQGGAAAPDRNGGGAAASPEPPPEIYLKLECLQPIGSFKLRGAANAMLAAGRDRLRDGVYTASAGNMAQGVAWSARHLGVPATAVVPDHAPATKLAAIERLGGTAVKVPFESWWQVIRDHHHAGTPGLFIHPVSDPAVMAGNGTIGLEILEDLPEVDAVLVPFGGGGLSCGIAAALRALRPEATVYACEITTAAPFAASLAAGSPQSVDYQPSFVDGIGGKSVLPEMWPIASLLLGGSRVVPLAAVAAAVRLLVERHRVVAEGAGATALAAALASLDGSAAVTANNTAAHVNATAATAAGGTSAAAAPGTGAPSSLPRAAGSEPLPSPRRPRRLVCIVSGGNIDTAKLATILSGGVP